MAISNFPASLQMIIQQGMLEREFHQALRSVLAYRSVCDREGFAVRIGETLTKTRMGLLATATTPLSVTQLGSAAASTASMLDNGMTPKVLNAEQYTITINEYADTINLNIVGEQVGIANQFVQNAIAQGEQAARTLDQLARNALFAPYMSGNTKVISGTGTSIQVDDVRGFQQVYLNGVQGAVSPGRTLTVVIGAGTYVVTGVVPDATNISLAPQGVSGVLTLSTAVSAGDSAVNSPVSSATAQTIIRPNARISTGALTATDLLTMSALLDAKAALEKNAVPKIDGFYHCFLDPVSQRQLFADPDFKQLFQGATMENEYFKRGMMYAPTLGLRMIPTTEAYVQTTGAGVVRRPIVCGQGALIEGDFEGTTTSTLGDGDFDVSVVDGISYIVRAPLDRLKQNVAQSWAWIGGFVAPTDITTNPATISTATNAAYKRAVVIEHIG